MRESPNRRSPSFIFSGSIERRAGTGVIGSSVAVPQDSNGCRNGCDGAHESCKPPVINRQTAVGLACDERFARFHFHQKWATGALRAAFQGTFVKSIRIYSALASPSYLRHMRFVLQIGKLTWMRPIAKGRSRPFQQRLDQTISTASRGVLDLRSVRNAYITQCPVIEFCQGSDSLFYLTLAAPTRPSVCNGSPGLPPNVTA